MSSVVRNWSLVKGEAAHGDGATGTTWRGARGRLHGIMVQDGLQALLERSPHALDGGDAAVQLGRLSGDREVLQLGEAVEVGAAPRRRPFRDTTALGPPALALLDPVGGPGEHRVHRRRHGHGAHRAPAATGGIQVGTTDPARLSLLPVVVGVDQVAAVCPQIRLQRIREGLDGGGGLATEVAVVQGTGRESPEMEIHDIEETAASSCPMRSAHRLAITTRCESCSDVPFQTVCLHALPGRSCLIWTSHMGCVRTNRPVPHLLDRELARRERLQQRAHGGVQVDVGVDGGLVVRGDQHGRRGPFATDEREQVGVGGGVAGVGGSEYTHGRKQSVNRPDLHSLGGFSLPWRIGADCTPDSRSAL